MKKGIYWGSILLATFIFTSTGLVQGSPRNSSSSPGGLPNVINAVQGSITFQAFIEIDDEPVDGDLDLLFSLWDAIVGGTQLAPAIPITTIADDGVVTVSLTFDPALFNGISRYLQIIVEGETLSPRILIESVPFAFRAGISDSTAIQTGVASETKDRTPPDFPFNLSGTNIDIISDREITAPTAGYALVMATAQVRWLHTGVATAAGAPDSVQFGVSDKNDEFSETQDLVLRFNTFDSGAATNHSRIVSLHGVFPVTAGTHTFYFLGFEWTPPSMFMVEDVQFTVVFIPSAVGVVENTGDTVAAGGDPDSDHPAIRPGGMEAILK